MREINKQLQDLLYPFAVLYGAVVRARNFLFDKKIIKQTSFELPIICIGNLSVGGTGKTPMAEYVLNLLLENGFKPALLSRGYKRQSKGYMIVKPHTPGILVGDEPLQVKRKFPEAVVVVCEKRVEGVQHIMQDFPEVNVIVLDDALQHRQLQPGFTIMLSDANKPFFEDRLLPLGRLREPRESKNRADVIIMTKCPQLPDEQKVKEYTGKVQPAPRQSLFFTCIKYKSITKVAQPGRTEEHYSIKQIKGYHVLLFTGIANPQPLKHFLDSQYIGNELMAFPDHHNFTRADIEKIRQYWETLPINKLLLTTEKDWRRLEGTPEAGLLLDLAPYFLSIEVEWKPEEKSSFDEKILSYVNRNTKSS